MFSFPSLQHGNDEISSVLIKEKMRENERKRSLASVDPDLKPAQFQLLEDEHLALMLQNKEFLEILQQDEDFMKMLERGEWQISLDSTSCFC